MSIVKIESEATPYGELKVYVTAEAGTHHSTIVSAVVKHIRTLEDPAYVSSVTRESKPGKWATPAQYSGPWVRVGSNIEHDTHIRKFFTTWPIPKL